MSYYSQFPLLIWNSGLFVLATWTNITTECRVAVWLITGKGFSRCQHKITDEKAMEWIQATDVCTSRCWSTWFEELYTVSGKKLPLYFRLLLSQLLADIYNFYTIGNGNKYSTIICNLLTWWLHDVIVVRHHTSWKFSSL